MITKLSKKLLSIFVLSFLSFSEVLATTDGSVLGASTTSGGSGTSASGVLSQTGVVLSVSSIFAVIVFAIILVVFFEKFFQKKVN